MPTDSEKIKEKPDSLVSFGDRRIKEIREFAETKFGSALVKASVNREDECFDIIVSDEVKESDIKDFETRWTMCKVYPVKFIPRKK